MRKLMFVLASALVLANCSVEKGGTLPTQPSQYPLTIPHLSPDALTSLLGSWSGTTTSTDGHSSNGSLQVVFSAGVQVVEGVNQDPQPCNGNDDNHGHSATDNGNNGNCQPVNIAATVTWTSNHTHLTFHGTASGPLSNITIDGSDNSCHYHASGALNGAGTTISGSYSFSGAGCYNDSGNYSISK